MCIAVLLSCCIASPAGRGVQSKKSFDEIRLILKKYAAVSTTQAELRDCSTELDVDELKKISASHKVS